MEERKFRYDAFISYRHTELDKFVAEKLIKQLEAYKLPRSVSISPDNTWWRRMW